MDDEANDQRPAARRLAEAERARVASCMRSECVEQDRCKGDHCAMTTNRDPYSCWGLSERIDSAAPGPAEAGKDASESAFKAWWKASPAERVSGPACTKDRESDASHGGVGADFPALVNRFLAWPLPESVCSDLIVTKPGAPHRIGTNLLTADETRAMLEYVLAKNPKPAPTLLGGAPATAPAVGLPGAAGEGPGKVTITCNEAGDCVAVTRTDDEGRILSVLWERDSVHSQSTQPTQGE